jgi:hypothetical protein
MASKQELEATTEKQERKLARTEERLEQADKTVKRAGGALAVGAIDGATGVLGKVNDTEIKVSDLFALKALVAPAKAGTWTGALEEASVTVSLYKAGEKVGKKVGESTGLSAAVAERLKKVDKVNAG